MEINLNTEEVYSEDVEDRAKYSSTEALPGNLWKEKALRLFGPLGKKLPKNEAAFWTVFGSVAVLATWMILFFVDQYSQDIDKMQTNNSIAAKYSEVFEGEKLE